MPLDFPNNPVNGQTYDNYYYNDSIGAWSSLASIPFAGVPSGAIMPYAGATAPSGYILCTGQSLIKIDYMPLFNAIGYQYGGSGANFNVPNLQGVIPVGKNSGTFATLGGTGGAESVTLTSAQIPAHSHPNSLTGTTSFASTSHTHGRGSYAAAIGATNNNITAIGYEAGGARPDGQGPSSSTYGITGGNAGGQAFNHYTPVYGNSGAPSATATVGISNANNIGGDGSHTNLQPYIVLNYIIKT